MFAQNFKIGPKWQKLKFWAKIFCRIFLQKHLFPTKSRPGNHVVWFILTSDHHKLLKQGQKGSKMSEIAIFDVFCLLTRKLIFFLQVLMFFLESAGQNWPNKSHFEKFPPPEHFPLKGSRFGTGLYSLNQVGIFGYTSY